MGYLHLWESGPLGNSLVSGGPGQDYIGLTLAAPSSLLGNDAGNAIGWYESTWIAVSERMINFHLMVTKKNWQSEILRKKIGQLRMKYPSVRIASVESFVPRSTYGGERYAELLKTNLNEPCLFIRIEGIDEFGISNGIKNVFYSESEVFGMREELTKLGLKYEAGGE